jgi:hypothetical protein
MRVRKTSKGNENLMIKRVSNQEEYLIPQKEWTCPSDELDPRVESSITRRKKKGRIN